MRDNSTRTRAPRGDESVVRPVFDFAYTATMRIIAIIRCYAHPSGSARMTGAPGLSEVERSLIFCCRKQQKQPGGGAGGHSKRGQSGNPADRPRGSVNRPRERPRCCSMAKLRRLPARRSSSLSPAMRRRLRLCLDRTIAPCRERPVEVALPPIDSPADLLGAIEAVAGAVGRGAIASGFALYSPRSAIIPSGAP